MSHKAAPAERRNGSKAKIYTAIRQRQRNMSRTEWQADFRKILDELQEDKATWEWLWHERRTYVPKGKWKRDGRLRPEVRLPDTKEMPY